jgi:hypothetical protein
MAMVAEPKNLPTLWVDWLSQRVHEVAGEVVRLCMRWSMLQWHDGVTKHDEVRGGVRLSRGRKRRAPGKEWRRNGGGGE